MYGVLPTNGDDESYNVTIAGYIRDVVTQVTSPSNMVQHGTACCNEAQHSTTRCLSGMPSRW